MISYKNLIKHLVKLPFFTKSLIMIALFSVSLRSAPFCSALAPLPLRFTPFRSAFGSARFALLARSACPRSLLLTRALCGVAPLPFIQNSYTARSHYICYALLTLSFFISLVNFIPITFAILTTFVTPVLQ